MTVRACMVIPQPGGMIMQAYIVIPQICGMTEFEDYDRLYPKE